MKKLFLFVTILFMVVLIFWLGKRFGSKNVNQQIISNSLIVKEIAELASLEVQGVANIKESNIDNSGDWSDNLKKAFLENTVWVTVPYTAKYGVDINEKNFSVKVNDKKIVVELPAPHLLSYELRVDKMETANRKGWLLFQDDETYTAVQKKLYQTNRSQMEANNVYMQQSKDKIRKIIGQYYAPFTPDHQLEIRFSDEKALPVLK